MIEGTRMLARRRSRFMLISSQPFHVQHYPLGEGRDSSFIRRLVGASRVKTLVPINPVDGHRLPDCRNPLEERLFQEVRGFAPAARVHVQLPLQPSEMVFVSITFFTGSRRGAHVS
jgi:hypothetical protein